MLRRKCEAFQIKSQVCIFPYGSGIKDFSSCELLEVGLYGLREGSSDKVLSFLKIVKMNEGSRNEDLEGMKTLHQTKSSGLLPLNRKFFSETRGLVILFLPHTPLTPFTYCFWPMFYLAWSTMGKAAVSEFFPALLSLKHTAHFGFFKAFNQ